MNRRDFLAVALLGGMTVTGSRRAASATRRLERIGLQLYTVRREMERDLDRTLARVAEIGFDEVEFAGYFGRSAKAIRAQLDRVGLDAVSTHVDPEVVKNGLDEAIEAAATLGARYVVCAWIPENERSLDDYRRYAERFNRAGEACRSAGLQFGYHNHDFEFLRAGDVLPFDLLLEETSVDLVKIELDLYWITKGGGSPRKYFDRYPGRFHLLHIKDMDQTPARSFADPGRGTIDFPSILAHSEKAGVRHLFVENDEPSGSPFESARIGYEYLKGLELG